MQRVYAVVKEEIVHLIDDRAKARGITRSQCDILMEKGKRPPLYRLRVGSHRIEYFIEGDTIFISKMFQRSGDSDYR
jgi:mRNA-degrading endonuclease RelE of RelBE toxin-antitoxin system